MIMTQAQSIIRSLLEIKKTPSIMIWGAPGIGKSDITRQFANELGWSLIDLRLAQMSPVDLRGIPLPDHETGRARWYPPEELPDESRDGKNGILFLDELANASRDVQTAALQLVLERKLGRYELPNEWKIVAAGNRVSDRSGSYQMASSLANRFIHIPLYSELPALEMSKDTGVRISEEDFDKWKMWAYGAGIHEIIISFLNYTGGSSYLWRSTGQIAYATPRTWEFASDMLKIFGLGDLTYNVISGCIGSGIATEVLGFAKVREQMPDPDAILEGHPVSAEPLRPDVAYALCGALISRLKKLENEADKNLRSAKIDNFFAWFPNLQKEFRMLLMKDCGRARVIGMFCKSKGFEIWAKENKVTMSDLAAA
jgi:hypothetical protein